MGIGMLSDRVETALRQAVFMACDDAVAIAQKDKECGDPNPRISAWNWPTAVLLVVEGAVRERIAVWQADLAVSRVPHEVLIALFNLLGTSDRACAILVCKSWNRILLGTSALWNRVDFFQDSPPQAVAAYVRLSEDVPLEELNVVINQGNLAVICSVLQEHIKRARRLAVRIEVLTDLNNDNNCLYLLQNAFASPAPLLQLFRLIDEHNSWNPSLASDNVFHMFAGQAPRLQMVKLADFVEKIYVSASTFINVTKFLFYSTAPIGSFAIYQVLDLCPALTHLGIELQGWDNDNDWQAPSIVVLPPKLVELSITAHDGVDPLLLLRHIDYSSLSRVSVANPRADYVESLLELFCHELEPVRTIALRTALDMDSSVFLRIRMYQQDVLLHKPAVLDSSVKERAVFELQVNTKLSGAPYLFRNLRTLYIHELIFHHMLLAADGGSIEMPNLETLIVTLAGPPLMVLTGDESIFFTPDRPSASLRCPKLSRLRIATPHGSNMLLDPSLVSMFLERWIEFDAPQLFELILHGTRLLESNAVQVAELLEKFVDFTIVEGPIQFNCVESSLLHWN